MILKNPKEEVAAMASHTPELLPAIVSQLNSFLSLWSELEKKEEF